MSATPVTRRTALFLAAGTGLVFAAVSYLLLRATVGSVAVGVGVAVMLFVMIAYPEAANRRVWGRSRQVRTPVTLRRLVIRVGVPGLCFVAVAIWLQSWLIGMVAVGYCLFWATMIYFNRDRFPT